MASLHQLLEMGRITRTPEYGWKGMVGFNPDGKKHFLESLRSIGAVDLVDGPVHSISKMDGQIALKCIGSESPVFLSERYAAILIAYLVSEGETGNSNSVRKTDFKVVEQNYDYFA